MSNNIDTLRSFLTDSISIKNIEDKAESLKANGWNTDWFFTTSKMATGEVLDAHVYFVARAVKDSSLMGMLELDKANRQILTNMFIEYLNEHRDEILLELSKRLANEANKYLEDAKKEIEEANAAIDSLLSNIE